MDKLDPDRNVISEPGTSGANLKQDESSDDYDSDDYQLTEESVARGITEDYEHELDEDLSRAAQPAVDFDSKPRRRRRDQSKITPHLRGLMGEANLRYARGEVDVAEKMCFELIRQVPRAHEPYLTLSQLYENVPGKSLQYLTIAAHLQPQNVSQWLRLAQIHVDQNNLRQAVTCYNRAIGVNPGNVDCHLKRIHLLEELNDAKNIRRCKLKLLHILSDAEPARILELAKELAEYYHQEKDYQKAIEIVNIPFEKCPKDITPEIVNIYLELLLITKAYAKCIDTFVQYCNIEIEIVLTVDNKIRVISYTMPEDIPIDLRIKFIICLIRLEAFHLLDKLLEPLLVEDNVEYIGDLYLDVAENLMSTDRHHDALKLLVPLIKSDNFSLAAVWLKYAECLHACKLDEQAIEGYFAVIRMAPQHIEVRYPLAELLLERSRTTEALEVLSQDYTLTELDVRLLVKKMGLLLQLGDYEGYFKSAQILLFRHSIEIKNVAEVHAISFLEKNDKIARLKKLRSIRGENYETKEVISLREPPVEEEYRLFKETLDLCYEKGEFAKLQNFAFTALSSTKFKDQNKELLLYALFSCIHNNDNYHGYVIIKDMVLRRPDSNVVWNLWNLILQHLDETRHIRFIVRQRKILQKPHLRILEANNALCCGSYKIAIMILMPLLKEHPTPFVSFLTGVVFLQLSQQKIGSRKKSLTPTVYSLFLDYASKRGSDALHEVNYNLGRMYHKYGLLHIAAFYYNLVLEFEHPLIDKYPDVLSLRREAAFNLFLIYKECSNYVGCRNLLIKYLTI